MENNCSGNYDYSELFKAFVGLSTQQATFKSTKHLTLLSQNGRNLINITKKLLYLTLFYFQSTFEQFSESYCNSFLFWLSLVAGLSWLNLRSGQNLIFQKVWNMEIGFRDSNSMNIFLFHGSAPDQDQYILRL